jgi:hypothetical protein
MTNAWFYTFTFHPFTASITPADSKRVMRGNGCQYRRAARSRTPGVNGLPDMVIPGIPETPDRTIPGSGSPGTPGGWHECP